MPDEPDSPLRRAHPRHLICVVMDMAAEGAAEQTAIIHNMSPSGAYVVAMAPVDVGEKLTLTLHLSTEPGGAVEETCGEALRVDRLSGEHSTYWTHGIAIRFDEPLTHLQSEIEALAAELEQAGVRF